MTATYDAYPSRTLSLVHSYNELLNELTKNTTDGLQISTAAAKLFNLSSISTVLTARPLMDPVPFEQKSIQKNKETTLIRYANPHALPVMHVSCRPLFLSSLDELLTIVKNPSYDEQNHVLLSSENKKYFPPTQASHATCNTTIQTIQNQDLSQEYRIVNNESFPVVAVQTFTKYPGWTAYVDDKEARILTANIRYRGVIIPPGSHTLVIKNTSQSLSYGMYVTFATAASISCVLIYLMQRKKLW